MSYDINSQQVDIENLFKQNENDLCSIKELYKKLKDLEKKISQIKYIDSKLADKLKKDYEKLKRIILDENIQLQLDNKINEVNSQLDNKINEVNSQLDTIETNEENKFVGVKSSNITNFIDLVNNNKEGATLLFPNNINLSLETTLKFDGLKNVTFKGNSKNEINIINGKKIIGFEFTNCDNITFDGFIFNGNGSLTSINDFGNYFIVYGKNSTNLTIQNCIFKNITDTCILDRSEPMTTHNDSIPVKIGNTIIENCKFLNCKHSYLTKGGGVKNVIYKSNFHCDCYTGVKIDGEIVNGDYNDLNGTTGNIIITNNIFENIGGELCKNAGLNCIMVEERVKNVIISDNIINGFSYVNGISFNTGQTCSYTNVVNVKNNLIVNGSNCDGIYIGEFGYDSSKTEAEHSDYTIEGNVIKNITGAGFKMINANIPTNNIRIINNSFIDCGLLLSGSIFISGVNNKYILIENNEFFVNLNANVQKQIVVYSDNSDNKEIKIKCNKFHCELTGNGNNDFVNSMIEITRYKKFEIVGNDIVRGIINIISSKGEIINNNFKESCIKLVDNGGGVCKTKILKNIFIQDETTSAYYLRIGDGGTEHIILDNLCSSTFSNPVYAANGSYITTL